METAKKFDCIKMVREIHDSLYNENKGKSLKEFTDGLIDEAHKSKLWDKVKAASNA